MAHDGGQRRHRCPRPAGKAAGGCGKERRGAGALQLLPGDGPSVGGPLSADPRIAGVCFTGSTATAQRIHQALAANASAHAVLIAETGGLNAMIVDSTALPEQAVDDIVASSFQSAGQRCSALRLLGYCCSRETNCSMSDPAMMATP